MSNKAHAQYADFSFNTREGCEELTFDTSAVDSKILIPRRYFLSPQATTTFNHWQFLHFEAVTEYNDMVNSYYRFQVESMYFQIYDMEIKNIEGQQGETTEDVTNMVLTKTEFPVVFYEDKNMTFGYDPKDFKHFEAQELLDQNKAWRRSLPIQGKAVHQEWRITRDDRRDKWWEKSAIKAAFQRRPRHRMPQR